MRAVLDPAGASLAGRRRGAGRVGGSAPHAAPETKSRRRQGPGATSGVSAGRSGQMLAAARAAGFLQVSSPGALPGAARTPPPAEGEPGGAQQGLGVKHAARTPGAGPWEEAPPARDTRPLPARGGAPPALVASAPPSPFTVFLAGGW